MNIGETKHGVTAQAWVVCSAACMLNLWKMRNDRIFNNKHTTKRKFQWLVAHYIDLWASRTPSLKEELNLPFYPPKSKSLWYKERGGPDLHLHQAKILAA
jgi:hypothetical protein